MNILLWVLLGLAALLYGASGVMKVFMFDKVSADVRSLGALPREAWMALGILELIGVHAKYRGITPTILSGVLGLLMAFIAYGRIVLTPLF